MKRRSVWRLVLPILAVSLTCVSAQSPPQRQSEQSLRDRVAADPAFIPGYLDLARLYFDQQRFSEAEAVLKRALSELSRLNVAGLPASSLRVGVDIAAPRKVRHADPVFPPVARAANITGVVVIDLTIARNGTIKDAVILRGQALLNRAALDAVRQWEFEPTVSQGEPAEVKMAVSVSFPPQ